MKRALLPGGPGAALPLAALALLALSPFAYRAWQAPRQPHLVKIAVLSAFSGQLQARGNDLYAAAQIAVAEANATHATPPRFVLVTALDDQGRAAAAADLARAVAADPGVSAVLCCTTPGAERATAPLLPAREPLFASLADGAALAAAEGELAGRQFGRGPAVLLSDAVDPAEARAAALLPTLRQAGVAVTDIPFSFAAGALPEAVARQVAAARPALVVLDMDYPAAAVLGPALRAAGVEAPLLGDERLDGAPAAALLDGAAPWWYVAPDRPALLARVPVAAVADFAQQRGHPPSSRDLLAYLQARAALGLAAPVDPRAVPATLYRAVPGRYPGQPSGASVGGAP